MARVIGDPSRQALFSAVSIWEIAIKAGLGRADFQVSAEQIAREALRVGFLELPLRFEAAARVAELPAYHRDPFDRILVAQAITEDIPFYTADNRLRTYSDLVVVLT